MICTKCSQPMKQLFSNEYCDCENKTSMITSGSALALLQQQSKVSEPCEETYLTKADAYVLSGFDYRKIERYWSNGTIQDLNIPTRFIYEADPKTGLFDSDNKDFDKGYVDSYNIICLGYKIKKETK